jgi:hypothetical protein
MIWLNPLALFGIAAVAAPILIHILVQRRAERVPFPTLRFLQPTRLAAIRRHLLEDFPLLAVRIALLASAAAALAGPLFLTSARRNAWNRRVVMATVTDGGADQAPPLRSAQQGSAVGVGAELARPFRSARFGGASLADGIRRAILWLDQAPPGRREIVIASPFPIGSISTADLAAIPPDIGVRFERTGTLPLTRTVQGGHVLTADGARARDVTLDGNRTSVHETAAVEPAGVPIDVVSSPTAKPAIDAAIAAVRSQRVWTASPDRRARLVVVDAAEGVKPASPAAQGFNPAIMTSPWMADVSARIARDDALRAAGARVGAGLADPRYEKAPWQRLTSAGNGDPLVVAAASADRLLIASAIPPSDLATPILVRAIANAIAPAPDLQPAEVVPIPDAQLQRWARLSAPLPSPPIETVDQDDRRWFWLAVIGLLAFEMWVRRARADVAAQDRNEERARVA